MHVELLSFYSILIKEAPSPVQKLGENDPNG